ncbi:MAG: ABC transporter substrate-binding protein [Selenomonadaceae bacterium]|nr:ABC transporter substrate-binding protein [Selenomonadaceae bacterium]
MKSGKKLSLLLSALLAMSAITGCGSESAKQASGEKVFTYGTMAYGPAMETTSTDPHNSYDGWAAIRYGVGETLFKFNENMQLVPWIAEKFEQVDEYTIRVTIKDNVVFSNGKKVTGAAVKACLEDLVARHDRAPKDLKIESITAEGQDVIIRSTEKLPALLNYLSDPYGCIIDVEAGIKDGIAVGTGPYKAVKVTDTQVDLVKNENYWGDVKPKMDKIFVKSITDGDTLTMAMQNGEVDAVQGLPYSSLDLFKGDTSKYKLSQTETSRVYQAAFNFKTPELQDIRIRKAISMAVDKDSFTKVLLNGNGAPAIGPFPANLSFGGDKVKSVPYDPEGAKALLAEAGYRDTDGDGYVDKDGKNLELRYLTYTSRQELPLLAETAQANLKKIGIKLNVNATDNYKAFLKNGEYDIFAKAIVTAPTGDPEYYFTSHIVPGAVDNAGYYDSPAIAAFENELHNTYGAEKRSDLAIKMGQQILDDCALFYASHLRMSFVMKPNIEGFTAHPSDYYEIRPELDKK